MDKLLKFLRTPNIPLVGSKKSLTLSVMLWLLIILAGDQAHASSTYKMKAVTIKADLGQDGSMVVSEERTYRFKGRFKYAFRTFPTGSGIGYEDFTVSEGDRTFLLSDNEEPGTYKVTEDQNEIEVRWFYRAKNETRTFVIDYQVKNAVKRYEDGAVLYYKFIGEKFRKSTGQVDITVNPPTDVDKWKVRQWAHGPLWGNSETLESGTVLATCENLPRKKFFELRILYPAELFVGAPQISEYIVDSIVAEETTWAETANEKRAQARENSEALVKRKKVGVWVLPMIVLLAGGWFFKIFRQYGVRPTVPSIPSSSADVPSDLPPAMVSYLIDGRAIKANSMMATLMDLARRGFLEFHEEMELEKTILGREKWTPRYLWLLKKNYFKENAHTLASFESMLIKFVFEDLAGSENSDSEMISVELKAFKKQKSKVQNFFGKWAKEVKKSGEQHEFYDLASFQGRNMGIKLGIIVLVLAALSIPLFHELALIPAIAGTGILLGASGIVHHNKEGRIKEKKWKSLKSYLTGKGLKASEQNRVLDLIGPYFIYGVVMGMSTSQLDDLGSMIPSGKGSFYMPWFFYQNIAGHSMDGSFGGAFSTAVASVNSAMSSSTGAGGGASGGGGGGAGGGGGGAG